jgi:hypothetical protein
MPAQTSRVLRPDDTTDKFGNSSSKDDKPSESAANSWWAYLMEKIEEAKAWANGVIHSETKDGN